MAYRIVASLQTQELRMPELAPSQLIETNGPRPLRMPPTPISFFAKRLRLDMHGDDRTVSAFLPLSSIQSGMAAATYLSSDRFVSRLAGREGLVVITKPALQDHVPAGNTVVLTNDNPRDIFYTCLADAIDSGHIEQLQGYVSPSAKIGRTAFVGEHVYVDDHAEIMPGAVVLPNTYVGPYVIVKPNATVGGDGFENAIIRGRRRVVPHAGGAWLSEGVQIGSATCVDRGLFGDFTYLGPRSTVDNLVHFAHSARCGAGCALVACCEISGSCKLGDGVWVGPNAAINQLLQIGDYCYIGTGSTVTRNLPPHTLAFGSPAKPAALVCSCRSKIQFESGRTTCGNCGCEWAQETDGTIRPA
jgi:UDP-3-O-[3-hydroxymyristoyl] glucosamine N-acyltransferase